MVYNNMLFCHFFDGLPKCGLYFFLFLLRVSTLLCGLFLLRFFSLFHRHSRSVGSISGKERPDLLVVWFVNCWICVRIIATMGGNGFTFAQPASYRRTPAMYGFCIICG